MVQPLWDGADLGFVLRLRAAYCKNGRVGALIFRITLTTEVPLCGDSVRAEFGLMQSIALLRDVLKRSPVAFLLGAGCPASIKEGDKPLVPTVRGLTDEVLSNLPVIYKPVAEVVLSRVRTQAIPSPNIESILSYVRTLASIIKDGDIMGVTHKGLSEFESEICRSIVDIVTVTLPSTDTAYHRLAAWTLAASGQIRTEFFTTNYDLLLEQALERFRVPYFDGFIGSSEPFFDLAAIENDKLPSRWAKLWKLHGSINWRQEKGRSFRTSHGDSASNLLIFPSHLKYDESRRLPYVAMADQLLAFLRQDKATLISCGFSYADEHLNDLVGSGLRANGSASLFALMFDKLDVASLLSQFAISNPSVSAYYSDGAIIGGLTGSWNGMAIAREAPRSSLVRWADDSVQFSGGDFEIFAEFLGEMVNYEKFDASSRSLSKKEIEASSLASDELRIASDLTGEGIVR